LRVILNAKAQRATIPPLRAVFAPLHSGKIIDISFEHFTMEETLSVGIGGDDQPDESIASKGPCLETPVWRHWKWNPIWVKPPR
jgi:hypothetical protein